MALGTLIIVWIFGIILWEVYAFLIKSVLQSSCTCRKSTNVGHVPPCSKDDTAVVKSFRQSSTDSRRGTEKERKKESDARAKLFQSCL